MVWQRGLYSLQRKGKPYLLTVDAIFPLDLEVQKRRVGPQGRMKQAR